VSICFELYREGTQEEEGRRTPALAVNEESVCARPHTQPTQPFTIHFNTGIGYLGTRPPSVLDDVRTCTLRA